MDWVRKRELEDREDHGLSQALCFTGCLWKWSTSASPGWAFLGWNSVLALPAAVPFPLFFPTWDFINLFFFRRVKMPGLGLGAGSSSICTWLDVGSATRRKNLSWLSDDAQPQTVRIYQCWDDYRLILGSLWKIWIPQDVKGLDVWPVLEAHNVCTACCMMMYVELWVCICTYYYLHIMKIIHARRWLRFLDMFLLTLQIRLLKKNWRPRQVSQKLSMDLGTFQQE